MIAQLLAVIRCEKDNGIVIDLLLDKSHDQPADLVIQMAYLIVMATTVALLFQNVGQVWSDPASASVILSLESVFGVLCSVIFYGDEVTAKLLLGFALIFVAVVCSETKFSFLRRKPSVPADDPV